MSLKVDGAPWDPWQPYVTDRTVTITGEGMHDIAIRFRDRAGNVSVPIVDSIEYDPSAVREALRPSMTALCVSPQPAQDHATIAWSDAGTRGGVQVVVTDVIGRTVATGRSSAGATQVALDCERLPSGMYRVALEGAGISGRATLSIVR